MTNIIVARVTDPIVPKVDFDESKVAMREMVRDCTAADTADSSPWKEYSSGEAIDMGATVSYIFTYGEVG